MARGIRFVVDSTADTTVEWRAQHHVLMVPLLVIFGDEQLRDGLDIQPAELYSRMRAGQAPRTSQPTPADFEAAFAAASHDGGTVVCTTISSSMSGTYASATAARASFPSADIRVIDTRTVAVGHLALITAAVEAAQAGATADEVVQLLQRIQAAQHTVFTVESLEYLRRGGRIGSAAALLGSVLSVKPILQVADGEVTAMERVRTYQRAVDRLMAIVAGAAKAGPLRIRIADGDAEAAAGAMLNALQRYSDAPVEMVALGAVVGCHAGPGVVGVSFTPSAAFGS